MNKAESHLEQLSEIRAIMERSSKFISLSGLSGLWVGSIALLGISAVFYNFKDYFLMRIGMHELSYPHFMMSGDELVYFLKFVLIDAALVLFLAIAGAFIFTLRKAKKRGQSIWDGTAKRFLVSFAVPLMTGGIFTLITIYHGFFSLAGSLTLIFYGLALFNAGRYSLIEIRYLGLLEISLGLLAAIFVGYSALFWAVGFGFLHIFYGTWMYFKYDR